MTIRFPLHLALRAAVLFAVLGLAPAAQAQLTGFTAEHGTLSGGIRVASDDLDLGVGVNGGYTLRQGIYLGGLFDYFFADDDEAGVAGFGVEVDWDVWFLMFEGGYDFGIGKDVVIRPTGMIGMSHASLEVCGSGPGVDVCDENDDSDPAGGLGVHFLYRVSSLTLGAELRFFFGDEDGVWFGFNVGGVL